MQAEAAMLKSVPKRSLTEDAQEVFRAIALIELGARMQVLESELTLSRDRMIRLYREVKGVSPPKGMLPFSADWYMTWLANIHASLFYNTYLFLKNEARCSHLDHWTKRAADWSDRGFLGGVPGRQALGALARQGQVHVVAVPERG